MGTPTGALKVWKKLARDNMKDPESRLEIKLKQSQPATLSQLSKMYRKSRKDTWKVVAKLIKDDILSISVTPWQKYMKK